MTLMPRTAFFVLALCALCCATDVALGGSAGPGNDVRAAEGDDVVLHRAYPKEQTVEVAVEYGWLLNPTFVDTQLYGLSVRYHWSESWGLGLTLGGAMTKDRSERGCVETFYNDPNHEQKCALRFPKTPGAVANDGKVDIGPAYIRVREIQDLTAVSADYTLAYGKQIFMMGAVNHFDLRVRFGLGALASKVYQEQTTVAGNRPSRGDPATAGVSADNTAAYGAAGRPTPTSEVSPLLLLGLQEQLHFFRRFFVTGGLTCYMTTGIDGGVDPFFVAEIGTGVSFLSHLWILPPSALSFAD